MFEQAITVAVLDVVRPIVLTSLQFIPLILDLPMFTVCCSHMNMYIITQYHSTTWSYHFVRPQILTFMPCT